MHRALKEQRVVAFVLLLSALLVRDASCSEYLA
jgi:hypothetical protein